MFFVFKVFQIYFENKKVGFYFLKLIEVNQLNLMSKTKSNLLSQMLTLFWLLVNKLEFLSDFLCVFRAG